MDVIGFDLMSKGGEHNLYQLGFILAYEPNEFYLDSSTRISECFSYYNVKENISLQLQSKINNIISLLKINVLTNKIHITGINLKLLIFIVIYFKIKYFYEHPKLNIHLHGQLHGYKTSFLKKLIWNYLSNYCNLLISNPAFNEFNNFHKIKNLNYLNGIKIICNDNNNNVFMWNSRGIDSSKSKKNLISNGFKIIPENNEVTENRKWFTYEEYIILLANCKYVHLGFYDQYYLYSPSGRLSESFIHNKVIIIDQNTENVSIGIQICKSYELNYMIV